MVNQPLRSSNSEAERAVQQVLEWAYEPLLERTGLLESVERILAITV